MTVAVLACPHCGLALEMNDTGATCASRHSFDRARSGHLNLMVGGRLGGTVTPGDTPHSLEARRRFLGAGHYAPIAHALAAALGTTDGPLLDVGCGEGYYLAHLPAPQRFGLDVSKTAVQMASKVLPDAQFVVASAYRLPVLSKSLAAVVSVFAPHPFSELRRVLRPGGRWATVTPGSQHLRELRPKLTGESELRDIERLARRDVPPPEATSAERLQFELTLDSDALADLFFMTPIRWQSGSAAAVAAGISTVNVDVWVCTGE